MKKLGANEVPYIMLITLLLGFIIILGTAVNFLGKSPTGQFMYIETSRTTEITSITENSSCYDSDGGNVKTVYGCVIYNNNQSLCDYCITNTSICELACTGDESPYCVADTSCGNSSMYCIDGVCQ